MSFPRNERDQWGGMGSNQPDGQQMMPLQPEMGSPALPQQMSNEELEASRVRVEFVAEQSRVIFLSSLPRDIYQDDIFDFFASGGTRPELLWTLMPRNGTGTDVAYAVFATHRQIGGATFVAIETTRGGTIVRCAGIRNILLNIRALVEEMDEAKVMAAAILMEAVEGSQETILLAEA
ncbi:hypothetical protein EG328_000334 [Venturia inaequalis]|uniref:RRM domain-containing protein n=1 Tax=Venturia inaequalis TaxID=5025 RepID=A0A8H3V0Y8_VENIN|nr:hypothetical protein EG328_000334 [Venturia inaequalis]